MSSDESPRAPRGAPPSNPGRTRASERVAEGIERVSERFERVSERVAALPGPGALIDTPTRRRAGVFRRALHAEVSRLRDPRRLAAVLVLGFLAGFMLACLIARGEASGADARAYWAAGRLWMSGGDPYHPTGPFMPYVYSPWMLPILVPWALLPWEVAWFVWRGATVLGFLWTIDWAYRRRPIATTVLLTLLVFPIAANLDTGNVNLQLTVLLFGAQFMGPVVGGLIWALATAVKWAPAVFWPFLSPRGRLWGAAWLLLAVLLTLATLPATLVQLRVLLGFPRPPRVDYLVFIWAAVPWLWRNPGVVRWLRLSTWLELARQAAAGLATWRDHWRQSPERTAEAAGRVVRARVRTFLGLGA